MLIKSIVSNEALRNMLPTSLPDLSWISLLDIPIGADGIRKYKAHSIGKPLFGPYVQSGDVT